MVPQTWIVLLVFMALVMYILFKMFTDESATNYALDQTILTWILGMAGFFVMVYISIMMVHCSAGHWGPTCTMFSWIVTSVIVLIVGTGVVADAYLQIHRRENILQYLKEKACGWQPTITQTTDAD